MGLNNTIGSPVWATNAATEGPTAFPIPQKKTPLFAMRSCSLRRKMESIDCPASVPNLDQTKEIGNDISFDSTQICTKMQ